MLPGLRISSPGTDLPQPFWRCRFLGGEFRFHRDAYVSVCGADMGGKLDGLPVWNWSGFPVASGNVLVFGHADRGCRSYLAINGGIARSLFHGEPVNLFAGWDRRLRREGLKAGDILHAGVAESKSRKKRIMPRRFVPRYPELLTLRVLPGMQENLFTEEGLDVFYSAEYSVSPRNDRMGYYSTNRATITRTERTSFPMHSARGRSRSRATACRSS